MNINVVIIGHVDHGKSTLIGRLLYDSESITGGRVEEIQKLAEEYKKRFEFAYFIDSFDDELKEERTIDTTGVMFKGKTHLYSITDVPGHKEFIKNMLTGASHADVAVLVVAADEGIREQTGRHAFLINMLGIKQLTVVVNKMDLVEYRKDRYEEIRDEVIKLVGGFGYEGLEYIPVSAMEGDNIYNKSERMPWYTGPTLIEVLDKTEVGRMEKPMRFVVQDTYATDSKKIVVGRVESGTLRKGDKIIFQPSGVKDKVKDIKVFGRDLKEAKQGDSIGVIMGGHAKRGNVGVPARLPIKSIKEFLGEVVLLEGKLERGDELELRCGTAKVDCGIKEIREKINSETGEVTEEYPIEIGENDAATIILVTDPVVVEKFSEIPELGRFVLTRDNRNVGAGVVLETNLSDEEEVKKRLKDLGYIS